MTVQYRDSGSNMRAVKASVWSVFYRAFIEPPSNRTQIGVGVASYKGERGQTRPLDWNGSE